MIPGQFIHVIVVVVFMRAVTSTDRRVKYIYFTGMDATTWTDARDNCRKMNSRLAVNISLNDWDLKFDSVGPFLNNMYWIGLSKVQKNWQWEDETILDYSSTIAMPLRPEFAANITWNCVLWNPLEPFYIPSDCSDIKSYICEYGEGVTCTYIKDSNQAINETGWDVITKRDSDLTGVTISNKTLVIIQKSGLEIQGCEDMCDLFRGNVTGTNASLECWMAEYIVRSDGTTVCRAILTPGPPVLVDLQSDIADVTLLRRHCLDLTAYINDTCDCRCINITVPVIPSTKEEFQKFVEEKTEEAKKELIVETQNLSAVVRKKVSAPDERESSTGMGYFGIVVISLVLGGLVLADLSSMLKDAKLMVDNVKSRFTD